MKQRFDVEYTFLMVLFSLLNSGWSTGKRVIARRWGVATISKIPKKTFVSWDGTTGILETKRYFSRKGSKQVFLESMRVPLGYKAFPVEYNNGIASRYFLKEYNQGTSTFNKPSAFEVFKDSSGNAWRKSVYEGDVAKRLLHK